jgi:hypothetical protein
MLILSLLDASHLKSSGFLDPFLSSFLLCSRCVIMLESSLGSMLDFLVSSRVQSPGRLVFRLSAFDYTPGHVLI